MDCADDTSGRGPKLVFHLHRFHHHKRLSGLDLVAYTHIYANHETRHWGNQWLGTRSTGAFSGQLTNGASAFIEGLHLEPMIVGPDRESTATVSRKHCEPVERPAEVEEVNGCAFDFLQMGRNRSAVDLDPARAEFDGYVLAIHLDDVLQPSSAGTSEQTTSTCAVCGNMSYARSDSTR